MGKPIIIAVDAMGGDHGPAVVIRGALQAQQEFGITPVIVGRFDDTHREAKNAGLSMSQFQFLKTDSWEDLWDGSRVPLVHAEQVVEMGEEPAKSYREKRNSSIAVGLRLVREGKADAFVSMGNTGAVLVSAIFILGRIQGVERPSLGVTIPTLTGRTFLLDVGANVDCKPHYLFQFAWLGSWYMRIRYGIPHPRVGLLNCGEEETKGDLLTFGAYMLLEECGLNFIGNVEGHDIPKGRADVVVCDGFAGNVALKSLEGAVEVVVALVKAKIESKWWAKVPALMLKPVFKELKGDLDHNRHNGAVLLGVDGVCIVGHGRGNEEAVKQCIYIAAQSVRQGLVDSIKQGFASTTPDKESGLKGPTS